MAIAIRAVQNHPNHKIALWSAIPCTGGSPWQYVNEAIYIRRGDHAKLEKLQNHRSLFRKLFTNFETLADIVIAKGGVVCIEWPTPCKYWRDPQVLAFTRRHHFVKTQFHGCAYGLQNRKGNFMKKPWSVSTNSPSIAQRLSRKCDGTHAHEEARGIDCKLAEGYTDMLAQEVHTAIACAFVSHESAPASVILARRYARHARGEPNALLDYQTDGGASGAPPSAAQLSDSPAVPATAGPAGRPTPLFSSSSSSGASPQPWLPLAPPAAGKDATKDKGKAPADQDDNSDKHSDKNSAKNSDKSVRHGTDLIPEFDGGGWFYDPATGWRQFWSTTYHDWIYSSWEEQILS